MPTAQRVIDTRQSAVLQPGQSVVVDVTSVVPADGSSVVINLTTTGTLAWGFFTCYPLDAAAPSETSNLNVNGPGQTRAAAVVVTVTTVGGVRGFKVWSYGGGHVIVDVAGYYTGDLSPQSSTGLFVPMPPQRILDTRKPGTIGRLWPGWIVETAIPDPARNDAEAVVANVTAVDARGAGFLTVLAARTPMQVMSNLNVVAEHDIVPNHVISRDLDGRAGRVLADRCPRARRHVGLLHRQPDGTDRGTVRQPAPAADRPAVAARRPQVGSELVGVRLPNPNPIVNAGHSWHWTGTGVMGEVAHVSLFAHRTTHGGIVPQHQPPRTRRRDVHRHDGQPPVSLSDVAARPVELADEQHLVHDPAVREHVAVVDRLHEAELPADQHRLQDHRHRRAGRLGRAVAATSVARAPG